MCFCSAYPGDLWDTREGTTVDVRLVVRAVRTLGAGKKSENI